MTDQTRSGQTSGSSSATVEQIRNYDWSTADRKQFLQQFEAVIGLARKSNIPEQEVLDAVNRSYHGGQSGTGSTSNR